MTLLVSCDTLENWTGGYNVRSRSIDREDLVQGEGSLKVVMSSAAENGNIEYRFPEPVDLKGKLFKFHVKLSDASKKFALRLLTSKNDFAGWSKLQIGVRDNEWTEIPVNVNDPTFVQGDFDPSSVGMIRFRYFQLGEEDTFRVDNIRSESPPPLQRPWVKPALAVGGTAVGIAVVGKLLDWW